MIKKSNYLCNCVALLSEITQKLQTYKSATVLVIIKLTKFAVAVRFRCGCSSFTFCLYFIIVLRCLRTLYIVRSLVRRRVTRRLTRFQTMCKYTLKRFVAVAVRLRLFFQFTYVQYCMWRHQRKGTLLRNKQCYPRPAVFIFLHFYVLSTLQKRATKNII